MATVLLRIRVLFLGAVCLGGLAGCSVTKDNAVFVTKTSFTLLDLDATPGGVSVAYDRTEGYAGPRFANGSVFPVVSYIAISGKGLERDVNQVYATGSAARIVTTQPKDLAAPDGKTLQSSTTPERDRRRQPALVKVSDPAASVSTPAASTRVNEEESPAPKSDDGKVMFFATGTTIGLKLGFADGTNVPTSFALGYKRKELSIIPVDAVRQPSVLATFNNSAGVQAPDATKATDATQTTAAVLRPNALFGVKQFFATGDAADNLAGRGDIQENFRDAARAGMGPLETYYSEAATQRAMMLDAMDCLLKVDDKKLDRVWANGDALAVFPVSGAAGRIRKLPVAQQREHYLTEIKPLRGAGGPTQTQQLHLHQQFVCGLSNS